MEKGHFIHHSDTYPFFGVAEMLAADETEQVRKKNKGRAPSKYPYFHYKTIRAHCMVHKLWFWVFCMGLADRAPLGRGD